MTARLLDMLNDAPVGTLGDLVGTAPVVLPGAETYRQNVRILAEGRASLVGLPAPYVCPFCPMPVSA
jgi:hypothetical protein